MHRPILALIKPGSSWHHGRTRFPKSSTPTRTSTSPILCAGLTLQRFFHGGSGKSKRANQNPHTGPDPTALGVEFRTWKTFFDEVETFSKLHLKSRLNLSTFDEQGLKALQNTKLTDEDDVKDSVIHAFEAPCIKTIETVYGGRSRPKFCPPNPFLTIGFPSRVLTFQREEGSNNLGGPRPQLVVNTRTPHDLPLKGVDIVTEVNKNRKDRTNKYLQAVHQLHGYMYYNQVEFGILTTVESTRVFRRIHTIDYPEGLLECSPEINVEGKIPNSPLAAYVFAVYKAFKNDPTYVPIDPVSDIELPKLIFQLEEDEKMTTPIPGVKLDRGNGTSKSAKMLRLWQQEIIGRDDVYVARAKAFVVGQDPETCAGTSVIVKMYSLYNPKAIPKYQREILVYEHLSSLQGTYIPRLYVSGNHIDGAYGLLVLEDCGEQIEYDCFQNPNTKEQAKKALSEIHRLGVLHKDLWLSNITYNKGGDSYPLRIVDFADSTLDVEEVTDGAKEAEMKVLEGLKQDD
ncbi:hypothetical protein TWF506_000455 [Arthrobotrys conoides]|uniref:Protein kinase domain-containing protein n=1 Tax=Arthrobotrys conoides TaxID=74498 RepID=A0AAN8RQJ6_9PEZI